jgi:hypothetical protein
MKVIVKLSHWYAKGLVDPQEPYEAKLLDTNGFECCLGFAAEAHGVPLAALLHCVSPEQVHPRLGCWLINSLGLDSALTNLAIALNDGGRANDVNWASQPLEVRMGNLISVFAEGGDDLEFVP